MSKPSEDCPASASGARPSAAVGLLPLAALSGLGGLCNGYSFTIIGGAMVRMDRELALSKGQKSLMLTSVLFGAMIGQLVAATLANKFGRRPTTFVGEALVFSFGLCHVFVSDRATLILVRVLLGVGAGICILAKPLLVSELAPVERRGQLVGVFSWAFSAGIVCAIEVDSLIPDNLAGAWHWETASVPVATSALLVLIMVLYIPESPHFQKVHSLEAADHGLTARCTSLMKAVAADAKALRIAMLLIVAYQGTGMAIIIGVSRQLLDTAGGLSPPHVKLFNSLIGVTHFAGACVGMALLSRGTLRRTQLLSSLACTSLALLAGAVVWIAGPAQSSTLAFWRSASLLLVIACFQIGMAPCFWVVSTEIFSSDNRPALMGLTFTLVFVLNIAGMSIGPFLDTPAAVGVLFLCCHALGLATLLLLYRYLPETSDKALGDAWASSAETTKTASAENKSAAKHSEHSQLLTRNSFEIK